jgi:hypothetical protein
MPGRLRRLGRRGPKAAAPGPGVPAQPGERWRTMRGRRPRPEQGCVDHILAAQEELLRWTRGDHARRRPGLLTAGSKT